MTSDNHNGDKVQCKVELNFEGNILHWKLLFWKTYLFINSALSITGVDKVQTAGQIWPVEALNMVRGVVLQHNVLIYEVKVYF